MRLSVELDMAFRLPQELLYPSRSRQIITVLGASRVGALEGVWR
jgi:hypothetical protein